MLGQPFDIEKYCAIRGFKLVDKILQEVNTDAKSIFININKALGILQQNGIFAFFVWLESKAGSPDLEYDNYTYEISEDKEKNGNKKNESGEGQRNNKKHSKNKKSMDIEIFQKIFLYTYNIISDCNLLKLEHLHLLIDYSNAVQNFRRNFLDSEQEFTFKELIFTKKILEKALTYGLYYSKAYSPVDKSEI